MEPNIPILWPFAPSDLVAAADSGDGGVSWDLEPPAKCGRAVCYDGCGRPASVCLCPFLPPSPLPTSTKIFVLQHPHELRHPLATASLLPRCLLNTTSLTGRRLRPNLSSLLDSPTSTLLYLFPSSDPTTDLSLRREIKDAGEVVLVVFDGTWRHAKEMLGASKVFLGEREAVQVSLGVVEEEEEGESVYESEFVLRKEPAKGCVSTMEAVARALRLLEPDEVAGAAAERALLEVLKAMVRFQARHLMPVEKRNKLKKKKKHNKRENEGLEATMISSLDESNNCLQPVRLNY